MKKLFPSLALMIALTTLSACSESSKKDDPAPKVYRVTVALSGRSLPSGTYCLLTSSTGYRIQQPFSGSPSGATNVDMATYKKGDIVEVSFVKGAATLPAGAYLRAVLTTDGVQVRTGEMNATPASEMKIKYIVGE